MKKGQKKGEKYIFLQKGRCSGNQKGEGAKKGGKYI
jgi:hypothetical protein